MWTPTLPAMTFYCLTLAAALVAGPAQADPDALLDHDLRRLHSSEVVNLKEQLGGSPLLLVNTASRCGFTGQFEGLEALHQRYAERGLKVAGFSSNDFNQEIDEEGAAEVCFINFGVTFDMFAPIPVRGPEATRCSPSWPGRARRRAGTSPSISSMKAARWWPTSPPACGRSHRRCARPSRHCWRASEALAQGPAPGRVSRRWQRSKALSTASASRPISTAPWST